MELSFYRIWDERNCIGNSFGHLLEYNKVCETCVADGDSEIPEIDRGCEICVADGDSEI